MENADLTRRAKEPNDESLKDRTLEVCVIDNYTHKVGSISNSPFSSWVMLTPAAPAPQLDTNVFHLLSQAPAAKVQMKKYQLGQKNSLVVTS